MRTVCSPLGVPGVLSLPIGRPVTPIAEAELVGVFFVVPQPTSASAKNASSNTTAPCTVARWHMDPSIPDPGANETDVQRRRTRVRRTRRVAPGTLSSYCALSAAAHHDPDQPLL